MKIIIMHIRGTIIHIIHIRFSWKEMGMRKNNFFLLLNEIICHCFSFLSKNRNYYNYSNFCPMVVSFERNRNNVNNFIQK